MVWACADSWISGVGGGGGVKIDRPVVLKDLVHI